MALLAQCTPPDAAGDLFFRNGNGFYFLVEEHVPGPSMLDILRTRSVLTAVDGSLRLVSLLAPVADHASRHRFQHVDRHCPGFI